MHSPPFNDEKSDAEQGDIAKPAAAFFWGPLQFLLRFQAFSALKYRQYRLIWYGQIFASLGTWMDQVTRGWLIYELTDSALQLGLVRGIQAIPFLLLSPVAGSAADRYSRKTQVLLAQLATGILYGVTALLIFTRLIQPWHVYLTAVLLAAVQVFLQPARAAMISDSVPPNNLTNAIGLNAVIFNVARTAGPALAGMLIALSGTGGAYLAQGIFFLLATTWTVQLHAVPLSSADPRRESGHKESFGRSILEGWKFSWRNEVVRIAILVVMSASLFLVPFTTLLPVFARDILGVGASGHGFLLTAMGIGALCSALLIASVGDRLPRGLLMIGGVMCYGVMNMIFAASPWFGVSLLLMALAGLCHVHSHALVQTVIQSHSPAEFRGRTMALFHMSQVVLTIGAMLFGMLSALMGAQWTVACMGAIGTLSIFAIGIALPRARFIR